MELSAQKYKETVSSILKTKSQGYLIDSFSPSNVSVTVIHPCPNGVVSLDSDHFSGSEGVAPDKESSLFMRIPLEISAFGNTICFFATLPSISLAEAFNPLI